MKKGIAVLLVAMLLFALAACGGAGGAQEPAEETPAALSGSIQIAGLNGPTGLLMAPMMDQEGYNISIYQAPDEITAKLVTGEVDIAAVPSNLAAVLYNKTEGGIQTIATVTLGVLYLVEDGASIQNFADLDGKTLYASGKGGVPEYVLQKLAEAYDITVNIEWLGTHADVAAKVKAETAAAFEKETGEPSGVIALLPEPQVSILQPATSSYIYHTLDLNAIWQDVTGEDLPMGVLVATSSFIGERAGDLAVFLKDAKAAAAYVNENTEDSAALLVEKKFFPNEMVAMQAVPKCNIVCLTAEDGYQSALSTLYETLFEMNPAAVGGSLPDEALFY